jgi:hypothetical protein
VLAPFDARGTPLVDPVLAPFDARGTPLGDPVLAPFDARGTAFESDVRELDGDVREAASFVDEPTDAPGKLGAIENGDTLVGASVSLGTPYDAGDVGSALPPANAPDAGNDVPPLASEGTPPPIVGDCGSPVDDGTSTWPGANDVPIVSFVVDVGSAGNASPPGVDGCATGDAAMPGVAAWPGTPIPDIVCPTFGTGTIDAPVRCSPNMRDIRSATCVGSVRSGSVGAASGVAAAVEMPGPVVIADGSGGSPRNGFAATAGPSLGSTIVLSGMRSSNGGA